MFRHLSPVATPLPAATWFSMLRPAASAPQQLQALLNQEFGSAACYFASSGRTAFSLLLMSLQTTVSQKARREILLPAYTCPALAKVVLDVGLQPRLVDIEPTTFGYVPAALRATLTQKTLAVVVVHPFGLPLDVTSILTQARQAGALVIEDAAQAMGAKRGRQYVGALGDYGLFSLGPGKPLSTGGGGIVCVKDPQRTAMLAQGWNTPPLPQAGPLSASLRLLALTAAFHPVAWWWAMRAGANRMGDNEANWGYQHTGLTNAQAQVALAQWPRLATYNQARRTKAEALLAQLQGLPGLTLPVIEDAANAQPIYLRLPLLVKDAAQRDALLRELNRAGIGVGRMYKRTLADFFPQLRAAAYPGAVQVAQQLITLPTHHFVTERDHMRMIQIFQKVFQ